MHFLFKPRSSDDAASFIGSICKWGAGNLRRWDPKVKVAFFSNALGLLDTKNWEPQVATLLLLYHHMLLQKDTLYTHGKKNHKVYLCVKPNLRTRRVSSGSSRAAWQTLFTICFSWTIFHPLWLLLSLSTYEFAEIGGELWARSSLVLFLLNNGFHLKSPRKWCNLHSAQTFAASATPPIDFIK